MSATEDGISDLMAAYLRDHDVPAVTQVSISTPGTRSQPDFQISDGARFVGEAKWEDKKWQGFGEARDYGQLTGVEGSFLIIYPEELKESGGQARLQDTAESVLGGHTYSCAFLRRDEPTDMVSLKLDEIPDWLRSNIERRRRPEPDPDEVVSVLRQTARELTQELETAPDENIFRNVLGATPDEDEEREAARKTAGFLLVNQLTFYRVLASSDRFPEIDPGVLTSPGDLGEYFDRVLEVDYTPVFSFRISDDLPEESLTILKDAIKTINSLSPEKINHDILGTVFHELIPIEARKQVAAYYTKSQPASIMADLSILDANTTVMDPACGSGTMLVAAYNRKKELSATWTEETHRQFVEEDITGIDVMPFAAHLSCIHLALQAPIYETDEVNIGIEDSTKLSPGSTISPLSFVLPESEVQQSIMDYEGGSSPDVSDKTVEAGSVTVDAAAGREMALGTLDAIIMNPPFTRQESVAGFADGYKSQLRSRFTRRDQRGHIHGKMSYCSYFMFLADKFLDEGGRIAAVLPATVLNKSSDSGVREMLLNEYQLEYVFAREDNPNFSEDTDLREIIVIARKGEPDEDGTITYVSMDGLDVDGTDIQATAEALDGADLGASREVQGRNESKATVWQLPYEQLDTHNLFSPFSVQERDLIRIWTEALETDEKLAQMQDLEPNLNRGGSSHPWTQGILAAPDTEVRRNDLWVVTEDDDPLTVEHRHIGESVEIPRSSVEPYFLRKPYRMKTDVSDIPEYTVVRPFDELDRFLSLAEQDGIPDGWEKHLDEKAAHMAIPETVDLTAPGTRHPVYYSDSQRVWHRMWMPSDLTSWEARVLTLWFDSSIGILQFLLTRVPGRGGWTKYRRYSQSRFYTLDPDVLSDDDCDKLERVWNEWKETECPSLVEQLALLSDRDRMSSDDARRVEQYYGVRDKIGEGFTSRKQLDIAVVDVLGAWDGIPDGLYGDLLMELVELKEMMES
jgi:hypothetical protein